jgi:hypothetical protein
MYVSQEEISKDDLDAEALATVRITETPEDGDPVVTELENAVCDNVLHWPEGYLFNIREKTKEEQTEAEIAALKEEKDVLIECILEMSEIIYA